MYLYMLGASHDHAPIAVRERLTFNGDDLRSGLQDLATIAHEGVILSTCNRTEIYALFDDARDSDRLHEFVSASRDIPRHQLDESVQTRAGYDAVRHLFRVACGLESIVLGEPQILTQIQLAIAAARQQQIAGPVVTRLCHEALRTGKLARTRTSISRNRLSISHAATDLAAHRLGTLRGRSALVIGAGQIATVTARILRNMKAGDIVIANRGEDRGRALADDVGGRYAPLGSVRAELARADVVFSAAATPDYVINLAVIGERARPLIAVDLGVPRTIDPAVDAHPMVQLFSVDDLEQTAARYRASYEREIDQANAIVEEAANAFNNWWRARAVVPTITALRDHAEEIRRGELERTLRRLDHLSERDRAHVEALTAAIVNKLLHSPVVQLKEEAHRGDHELASQLLLRMLGVENPTP